MPSNWTQLERELFRRINSIVEPAVRRGIGSSRLAPASLIVLETRGFKTGKQRRTPLWSLGLGRYRLVSTVRGDRSFWVKNLQKEPNVTYYLGGKQRRSEALVFAPEQSETHPPRALRGLAQCLTALTRNGWAFALLVPESS